ncbi:MAG: Spore coat [Polaromonas sp.]|nr:Spore coat [Polaromonas sp.]
MKARLFLYFLALGALLFSAGAQAVINCSVNAGSGYFAVYDGLANSDNLNSSTFTVNCTRTLTGDPLSVSFTAVTDDGTWNSGGNNRAKLTTVGNCSVTTNCIKYDFYTNSTFSTNWSKQTSKAITGTVSFANTSTMNSSTTTTYYSKIPLGQTGLASGLFQDTVTINLAYTYGTTNASAPLAAFSVNINTVSSCQFVMPPSNMSLNYTAFSAGTVSASTSYTTRCSTSLGYTMALDYVSGVSSGVSRGVASGIQYSLALGTLSGSGNGAIQGPYSITATAPAGQAGSCNTGTCTGTTPHTVTIIY